MINSFLRWFFIHLQLQIKSTEILTKSPLYQKDPRLSTRVYYQINIHQMQLELHPIILNILISNELD